MLITNAKIITPSVAIPRGWLLCRDGKIAAMAAGDSPDFDSVEAIDANGLTLLPGFIDVHVHGGMGHDTMDATPEPLNAMSRFYAAHGVTSFLATTWTDSHTRITAALENVHNSPPLDGATMIGVHLEGPYLNPEKCGAQNINYIRRADRDEALSYLDYGLIRLLSLAPEYPENHWLIRECVRRGITVSTAHSSATYDQIRHAINLGLAHATHTYNAMTGLHHREPGTLGAVMESDQVRCEVIADGVHVHLAAVNLLWRLKSPDKLVLISDAIRPAGMPDGEYQVDERIVTVKNSAAKLHDGTLSGSTLTMDVGLRNFRNVTGEPLENIWQVASLNPAQAINLGHRKGSVEIGKDADLILVDENLNVRHTIIMGRRFE